LAVACAVLFALAGCGGADKGATVRAPGVKYSPAAAHRLDAAQRTSSSERDLRDYLVKSWADWSREQIGLRATIRCTGSLPYA